MWVSTPIILPSLTRADRAMVAIAEPTSLDMPASHGVQSWKASLCSGVSLTIQSIAETVVQRPADRAGEVAAVAVEVSGLMESR